MREEEGEGDGGGGRGRCRPESTASDRGGLSPVGETTAKKQDTQ